MWGMRDGIKGRDIGMKRDTLALEMGVSLFNEGGEGLLLKRQRGMEHSKGRGGVLCAKGRADAFERKGRQALREQTRAEVGTLAETRQKQDGRRCWFR